MKGKVVAEDKVGETPEWTKDAKPLLGERQPPAGDPPAAGKNGDVAGSAEKPDGGWGWCVVLAGATCMMLVVSQGPCFGVLYGQRLKELGASPSLATWLFNIQSLIWNLAGPWAGPLTEVASYRTIAASGSLLAVSSLFISPHVTDPHLLLLTVSTIVGVGGGLTIVCCYHMTALYFNKRLGLANGFVVAGGSLGLILMPQLTSLLQEQYPFMWASFILGAVVLHAPAMMLLLHPVSWHSRPPRAAQQVPQVPSVVPLVNDYGVDKRLDSMRQGLLRGASVPVDLLKLGGGLRVDVAHSKRLRTGSECQHSEGLLRRDVARPKRLRTCSECQHSDGLWMEQRGSAFRLGGSTLVAGSVLTLQNETITEEEQQKGIGEQPSALRRVWRKFRSQYNVQLMKDPLATSIALATCCTITSAVNIVAIIPFVLAEANYTLQETATAMSVAAIVDLFTRLLGAAIADCPKVDVRFLYFFAQLIYIVVPYGKK
ncbi:uncharacterized protein LOC126980807 isoform X2 [Eriocheir sinensis]|uniref:uncharacterized protein LOC126980807 isoform X2 n=1 Tax=Eriocheir sinensis TaxID=95602 RepID=UPI0021C59FE7|nr:uncharacterized protein LOC126980807 isoform X2 [Eriocheir sinensis]